MSAEEIRLPRSGVVLRPVSDAPNCREFILGDWEMGLRRFGDGAVGVEFWTVKNAGGCYAGTEAGAIARLDSRVLALRSALGFDAALSEERRRVVERADEALRLLRVFRDGKPGHEDMIAADRLLGIDPSPPENATCYCPNCDTVVVDWNDGSRKDIDPPGETCVHCHGPVVAKKPEPAAGERCECVPNVDPVDSEVGREEHEKRRCPCNCPSCSERRS